MCQAGFRKGRGTRDQIENFRWILEKEREIQKNFYLCFIESAKADCVDTKAFDCVDHNKLWKTLKKIGIPDHLTCLLRRATQVRDQGRQPGGATPCPRSGAAAERSYPTSEVRGGCQPRGDTPQRRSGAVAGRSYHTHTHPRPGVVARRSYPTPEARGGGQELRPGGPTPHPRSSGYADAGGPRGAIPR